MRRLLIACLALSCAAAQAQVYRWTDASGRTVVSDTPPPGKARNVERNTATPLPDDGQPYAVKRAAEAFPVVLYTAPNCVTECQQARELLNGRGVPFTERKLEKPEEIAELKQLVGEPYVPSLKVGNQSQRGYDANAWHKLLDLAAYPKTAAKRSTSP